MEQTYYGFADIEAFDASAVEHIIRAFVTKEQLEFQLEQNAIELQWANFTRFTTPLTEAEYNRGALEIARLVIDEFPVPVKYELGESWFGWFDAIDGDLAVVGEIADTITEEDAGGSFSLLSGSLFYPRALSVHPAFQGQRVGIRLLAHALWAVHRADGDTAILLAKPTRNYYSSDEPTATAANIRSLAKHYSRIGFRRVRGQGDARDGEPVAMILRFGEERLPVSGLGEMGR